MIDWRNMFRIRCNGMQFYAPADVLCKKSGYFRKLFDNYPSQGECVCDDMDPLILNMVIDMMVRKSDLRTGLSKTQLIQTYMVCDVFDIPVMLSNIMEFIRSASPNYETITHVQTYGTMANIEEMWVRYCDGLTIMPDIVDLFLKAGANIDHMDEKGLTPLIRAIMRSDDDDSLENVNTLIRAKSDLNARNEDGMTALMLAIVETNCDFYPNTGMWTHANRPIIVDALIHGGSNLNACDSNGLTALMWSCLYSNDVMNLKIVNALIRGGANLDMKDKFSRSAISIAIAFNRNANNTVLLEIVNALIRGGADLNIMYEHGLTALMLACEHSIATDSTEIVEALINAGANIDAVDLRGKTALMMMTSNLRYRSSLKVVTALIGAKPNLDAMDSNGWTALMFACMCSCRKDSGSLENVNALIHGGYNFNLDARNIKGDTALMMVIRNYNMVSSSKIAIALKTAGAILTLEDMNVLQK